MRPALPAWLRAARRRGRSAGGPPGHRDATRARMRPRGPRIHARRRARRTRRRPRQWGLLRGAAHEEDDDDEVRGQLERLEHGAVPWASFGPGERKNGMSAPSAAASSCRRASGSGSSSVSFASCSAAAASELPPPRPAATGICFSIVTRQTGHPCPPPLRAPRARRGRACRSSKPVTWSSSAESSSIRSASSSGAIRDTISCLPSSRTRTDEQGEVQLFGASVAFMAARRQGRRSRAVPAPRRERWASARASRAQRKPRRGSRGQPGRVSSRASCAGGRKPAATTFLTPM